MLRDLSKSSYMCHEIFILHFPIPYMWGFISNVSLWLLECQKNVRDGGMSLILEIQLIRGVFATGTILF